MSYTDGIVVGVRLARVAPLAADGSMPANPAWKVVPGVTSVQRAYQRSGSQNVEIRGEDRQLAQVSDPGMPIAIQLTLQGAVLDLSLLPTVVGGTYTAGPPASWTAPRVGDSIARFALEFYAAEYGEGSQTTSDEKGFVRYFYPNCYLTGGPDSTHQDRQAAQPQMTVYGQENTVSNLAFEKIEKLAALPA